MIGSRRAVAALSRRAAASSSSSSSSTSNSVINPRASTFAISSHATGACRRSFSTTLQKIHEPLYSVVPASDFGEFEEYSVIFTNRSLNLMSEPFQQVMRDLNTCLKTTYQADKVAIIPGSGTFGMEAVMRQFAQGEHVMVIRNGWFSFRWTEIADMGAGTKPELSIPKSHTVLKAQPVAVEDDDSSCPHTHYAPYPIDEVVQKIYEERPAVLFAPHVETSTGMILDDDYIRKATAAMHEVGGLFVLDCIASGTVWADMKDLGVDVVISAPQKGWTGPACAALVMMSDRAAAKMEHTEETSFSLSLKRWSSIMDLYERGGFGYHTTMPTDALRDFHEVTVETMRYGMPELKAAQMELGKTARELLDSRGLTSVAAPGSQAPGVLVYYSPLGVENPLMMTRFKNHGLQIAMGVPWRIDEPDGMQTFRLGLFGLDKMADIPGTVGKLEKALDAVLVESGHEVSVSAAAKTAVA